MARPRQVKRPPVASKCYAIEKILHSRSNGSKLEYLIKWKSRPESENSWQSVDDLISTKKSTPETTHDITRIVVIQAKPPGTQEPLTRLEHPNARATAKRAREDGGVSETEQPPDNRRRGMPVNLYTMDEVSNTPKTSKMPRTTSANAEQEEADKDVDHIKKVRKRKGLHEYLVKWKNSDDGDDDGGESWIGGEAAKAKYPQHVIAYYQSIIRFK